MTGTPRQRRSRRSPVTALLVAIAAIAATTVPPLAEEGIAPAPWTRHPGFVSGEPFVALASENGDLVEVSVTGSLLRLVASTVRAQDAELAAMIEALAAVSAVIVDVDKGQVAALERAERDLSDRMNTGGWTAIARVRDGATRVTVWVLPRGERLEGLTVLVRDGSEIVFTNIAGTIDMERLQALAGRLNLPGLEQVLPGDALPGTDRDEDEETD